MSLGYADRLSFREDLGGALGAPEHFDPEAELEDKIEHLAQLIRDAKRIIAFTGAGISTSCGIPDFRGPQGVWTMQRAGLPSPKPKCSFAVAKPSLTHQALAGLMNTGKLTYIVSQNVDGLHLRSGIPRRLLAELHGNCFSEGCKKCGTEYIRDFEVETVGFKPTGRKCTKAGCGGRLTDKVLDWEDALPEDELQLSEEHARQADLAICLGTSLQITPACNLPLKTIRTYKNKKETAGKLVIINLQKTQHDKKATDSGGVVIHAKTDHVMARVMAKLGMQLPTYVRNDSLAIGHSITPSGKKCTVFVRSIHGPKCEMPAVDTVAFSLEGLSLMTCRAPPYQISLISAAVNKKSLDVTVKFVDAADGDKRRDTVGYILDLEETVAGQEQLCTVSFTTQVVDYNNKVQAANDADAGQEQEEEDDEEREQKRAKTSDLATNVQGLVGRWLG